MKTPSPIDEAFVTDYVMKTFANVETINQFGYTFFFYGSDHKIPFATIASSDNEYDRVSNLDRVGVFRLNVGVGRATFQSLLGERSIEPDAHDFTKLDTIMPHPHYAAQNFMCVLSPSEETFEKLKPLLAEAYDIARRRHTQRSPEMKLEIPGGFYLNRIQRSDKAAYLEHLAEPEIAANTLAIPFPYTDADADAWLDLCEKEAPDLGKNFAIREAGGYLIGGIGITNQSGMPNEAEFGYWLAKPFWGRGIMTGAVEVFADYAFQKLKLRRLYAMPFVNNAASQRVLDKAGFKNEGVLERHHEKNGVLLDLVLYGQVRNVDPE